MGGEGASVGGSSTCEVRSSAVSPWEGAGGGGVACTSWPSCWSRPPSAPLGRLATCHSAKKRADERFRTDAERRASYLERQCAIATKLLPIAERICVEAAHVRACALLCEQNPVQPDNPARIITKGGWQ